MAPESLTQEETVEVTMEEEEMRKLSSRIVAIEGYKATLWLIAATMALIALIPFAICCIALARVAWNWGS